MRDDRDDRRSDDFHHLEDMVSEPEVFKGAIIAVCLVIIVTGVLGVVGVAAWTMLFD